MFRCPECDAEIQLAVISDADLKAERGRRNAARRHRFGSHPEGVRMVWRAHNPSAKPCRCARCLIAQAASARERAEIEAAIRARGIPLDSFGEGSWDVRRTAA